ncbi:hypothetical protein [Hymenobacter sp. AT01-02]|uniref:hypothetical protein n=1 Tax=Hymenobacter sp. AT01-02 TaxID=1571877 RepID=UPI000AC15636|nr:hypothetical protein [Hymenobacter sp. AT01-02]
MRSLSIILPLTLLLLSSTGATAQIADSTARPIDRVPTRSGTLVKVGTGLTRGLGSGYWGVSLPVVVGAEHHLTSAISVYGNGFAGIKLGRSNPLADGSRAPLIHEYGFDLGVRYYYNQEKRRQKERATGPFVGNYLAVQTTTVFNQLHYNPYRYSTLTAIWGMQRRLGKYGWFDAYVGAGVDRRPGYT